MSMNTINVRPIGPLVIQIAFITIDSVSILRKSDNRKTKINGWMIIPKTIQAM